MGRAPLFSSETNKFKKCVIFFKTSLDFAEVMWYCVVLTGGATNGKHNKRTVARQHHTRGGQQNQLKGDAPLLEFLPPLW